MEILNATTLFLNKPSSNLGCLLVIKGKMQ